MGNQISTPTTTTTTIPTTNGTILDNNVLTTTATRDTDNNDDNDDCQFPCFFFNKISRNKMPFQVVPNHNVSNNNIRRKSQKNDLALGSPLPDTPLMERRRRQEITHHASTVVQREQQQKQRHQRHNSATTAATTVSSSPSPTLLLPPQQQQQQQQRGVYTGLEKEDSSRSFRLPQLIPPTNPNQQQQASTYDNNNNHRGFNNNNGSSTAAIDYSCQPPQPPPQHAPQPPSFPEAEIYEGDDCEERLYEKYELCEVLGVGSTSTVHRCICKDTGQEYACKIIDIQNMDVQYHSMMIQFHTEITSLKSIHHPGIIQLYDVYILSTIKIYIIMELMLGGELFDYVVEKGTLSEEEASQIVRTVLSAIHYLHTQNIIHRDLKPENLLLKYPAHTNTTQKDKNNKLVQQPIDVKIIDFGLSKLLTTDDTVASTFLGTRGYLAPEMLQRRVYTSAVDTWAMGVIVFVLLCGCLPFDDDATMISQHDDHILQKRFVLRFPRWAKNLSNSAKDLLNHLLDINPITRYTAEQALYHPWVRGETAPSKNLLASPGRIRKSPAITATHRQTHNNNNNGSGHRSINTKNHLGRKYAPDPCSLTPPTPRVRKGSF